MEQKASTRSCEEADVEHLTSSSLNVLTYMYTCTNCDSYKYIARQHVFIKLLQVLLGAEINMNLYCCALVTNDLGDWALFCQIYRI